MKGCLSFCARVIERAAPRSKIGMRTIGRASALIFWTAVAAPSWAQVTIPQEYGKHTTSAEVVGALGTNLFGDQTNFYTGATEFVVTDVSMPGNNALPVAVGRRFSVESREVSAAKNKGMFGDWDLEIPHLHGVFAASRPWQVQGADDDLARRVKRCSVDGLFQAQPPVTTGAGFPAGLFFPYEYWQGNHLYVPGAGDQEMLVTAGAANANKPTDGKTYYWVTKDQWYFSCLPATANGVPGEGFLALAPDGTRYWFDQIVVRAPAPYLVKPFGTGTSPFTAPDPEAQAISSRTPDEETPQANAGSMTSLTRADVWILPTRVQDRFGNTVTYSYDSEFPSRLLGIVASDGRQLTLGYNPAGNIATVSSGTRTWTYGYAGSGDVWSLNSVGLPDLSSWTINFGSLVRPWIRPYGFGQSAFTPRCDDPAMSAEAGQQTYVGTVAHPSGAVAQFTFKAKEHGRSYVQKACVRMSGDVNDLSAYARNPYRFAVISLLTKEVSGPAVSTQTWSYNYGPLNNSWAEDCTSGACASTKVVEVVEPGEYTRYTFGNRHLENHGKLLKTEKGASAADILRTEASTYLLNAAGQPFPERIGLSPNERGDRAGERLTPLLQSQITQQGRIFTWQVATGCQGVLCFDMFARPTTVVRSSVTAP